jgi:mandelamide amidase
MRRGELRADDYARALLARARAGAHLNAFLSIDEPALLEAARSADRHRARGAATGRLHGLPIPVKDSINTARLPTTQGTRALQYCRPRRDAAVLTRLWGAGALLFGKTALHEMSRGWTCNNAVFGPVRNPCDPARIPGGSSGGSAVAVAFGMAPLALGEDTLGSIRVPASLCGIAGLRPTFGRYPGEGVMPLTLNRFDQVGPLARTVEDLALFDAAVTGDARPLARLVPASLRLGVPDELFAGCDTDAARALQTALQRLAAAGVQLVHTRLPAIAAEARTIARTVLAAEGAACLSGYLASYAPGIALEQVCGAMSPDIQSLYAAGQTPRAEYEQALERLAELRGAVSAHLRGEALSALVFPPALTAALPLGDNALIDIGGTAVPIGTVMGRNAALGSCAGLPSLVLPAGRTAGGLPVGLEFAAGPGRDRDLLALGRALEPLLAARGAQSAAP